MMFRFTIRDLLWLTVVVGMACALVAKHISAANWRSRAQEWESRAQGAAAALRHGARDNSWHGDGIVVTEPASGTNVPILRVYRGAK